MLFMISLTFKMVLVIAFFKISQLYKLYYYKDTRGGSQRQHFIALIN